MANEMTTTSNDEFNEHTPNEIDNNLFFVDFNFNRINDAEKKLEQEFKSELEAQEVLSNILKQNINNININIHKATDSVLYPDLYLIFLVGKNDRVLIKLGTQFNFPRGFPIIWRENHYIHLYGFYPKFDNDDINEIELPNLEQIKSLSFNFKYSGFLGQIIPFKYDDKVLYTVANKNSVGLFFRQQFKNIINLNSKLLTYLIDEHIHICGETMSTCDQTHGNIINKNAFLVTMIAKGVHINIIDPSNNFPTDFNLRKLNPFLEYLPIDTIYDLCTLYNLDIDNMYNIYNTGSNINNIFTDIYNNRNKMDINKISEILKKHSSNIKVLHGNASHNEICGNVLEGLIIKISYNSGIQSKTIKYKFPLYTVRTMLFRPIFGIFKIDEDNLNINSNINNYIDSIDKIINYKYEGIPEDISQSFFKYIFRTKCNNFLKRWVLADQVPGYNFWCNVLSNIVKNIHMWFVEYKKLVNDIIADDTKNHLNLICGKYSSIPQFHIFLGETITLSEFETYDTNICREINIESKYDMNLKFPIIIILGPVGYGKSKLGQQFEITNNHLFEHIDGDILDLGTEDEVYKLSIERNDYTFWLIFKAILMKKIPVLSTGGGILISLAGEKLISILQKMLRLYNIELNIIILIPSENEKIMKYSHNIDDFLRHSLDIYNVYNTNLPNIINNRYPHLDKKKYDEKSAMYKSINSLNKKNIQTLCKKIVEDTPDIISIIKYPGVTQGPRTELNVINFPIDNIIDVIMDMTDLNLHFNLTETPIIYGFFTQQRILVKYNTPYDELTYYYHHITLKYDSEFSNIICEELKILEFYSLNISIKGTYYKIPELKSLSQPLLDDQTGEFRKQKQKPILKSSDNASCIELVLVTIGTENEILNNNELIKKNNIYHITVNDNKHSPKYMNDVVKWLTNESDDQIYTLEGKQYDLKKLTHSQVDVVLLNIFNIIQ